MKSSELRIGNFVLKDGRYRKVEAISIPYHHLLSLRNKVLLEECQFNEVQPISLSEEILLKCPEITKCTYHEETWRIRDPKSQFHIVKHNDRFVFRGVGMSVIYVDTLHHLQNLVYVNTLKELEVGL